MSRGLGAVQRFVLDQLGGTRNGGWLGVPVLIARRHGEDPTPAEVESLRRAVRTLGARGLIETRKVSIARFGRMVEVRLPLSDAEREQERKREEQERKREEQERKREESLDKALRRIDPEYDAERRWVEGEIRR